jgi:hypothetical protein
MLDNESGYGDEPIERVPSMTGADSRAQAGNLVVRRRIEHMRELLDDPDFDELS